MSDCENYERFPHDVSEDQQMSSLQIWNRIDLVLSKAIWCAFVEETLITLSHNTLRSFADGNKSSTVGKLPFVVLHHFRVALQAFQKKKNKCRSLAVFETDQTGNSYKFMKNPCR